MKDLNHTGREDVRIKTEAPWHASSDSTLKIEASTQAPDIK